ncbi:hypothetical protein BC830DRAFT_493057 [Chytriomyces sp. MP71]|nr:hypothetical protein BC830DRAFT_493057 [Chytriomyces sp. MP71]
MAARRKPCTNEAGTTMDTASFTQYAVVSATESEPSDDDDPVWWFASQSQTVQDQVASNICSAHGDSIVPLYQWMNATFALNPSTINILEECASQVDRAQLNSLHDDLGFYRDPNTPKSRSYFFLQSKDAQIELLNYICIDTGYPMWIARHILKKYFDVGTPIGPEMKDALTKCLVKLTFLNDPLNDAVWFSYQGDAQKLSSIVKMCGNTTKTTNDLSSVVTALKNQSPYLGQQITSSMDDCLTYHNWSPNDADIFSFSNLAKQWFASRNATAQEAAINFICYGSGVNFNATSRHIQTFPQILATQQLLGNSLQSLQASNGLNRMLIDNCLRPYEHFTRQDALSIFSRGTSFDRYGMALIWFASQKTVSHLGYSLAQLLWTTIEFIRAI